MKTNRQGVRDLNGPRMEGQQTNRLPKQRDRNVEFCRHADVQYDNSTIFPWWRCKTCGALWEHSYMGVVKR